jgi:hypothetical protein
MAERGWEVVDDWGVEPDDHIVESAKNTPVDPRRFSLNKDPYYSGYDTVRDEDKRTKWSDVGQALKIGAINTAEAPAIISDYMTSGAIGSDTRREAELTKRDIMNEMTPQGRRAATAPFLGDKTHEGAFDVGIGDYMTMGVAQNAAPMIASIVPAWMATSMAARAGLGLAGRSAVGAGVARGSSAAQNMADVTSSILDEVNDVPDEKLRTIPLVQQYMQEGMNIEEARGRYRTEVAKYYPLIAAVVGAVSAFPEAEAVKTLAGASGKKGLLKGAIGQIGGGAAEEFAEEGSGAALTEMAGSKAGLSDIDYHNIISSALGGAAQGGVLHAPTALVHLGADAIAPEQKVALSTQTSTEKVVPPAATVAQEQAPPPPPPASPQDAISATNNAEIPADIAAAIQNATTPEPVTPSTPASDLFDQTMSAQLPPNIADNLPTQQAPNDEADAWEVFDNWGAENTPDVIRYDDGTIEEVAPTALRGPDVPGPYKAGKPKGWMTTATERAIRQAEEARAQRNAPEQPAEQPSEQEYWDAYDEYKNEQATQQEAETPVTSEVIAEQTVQPSDGVTGEAAPVAGAKGRKARRTAEEIAAANAEKAAVKAAAKAEKARLAVETAQKKAAEKAAQKAAKAEAKNKNTNTELAPVKPTAAAKQEEQTSVPSGVLGPVFIGVAKKLATKTRVSAEGSHEAQSTQAARKAYAEKAEEAFYAHPPGEDEVYEGPEQIDLLRPKDSLTGTRFVRSVKQRKAIRTRIEKFLKSIEGAGHEIPTYVTKNSNNFQLYARVAKDLLKYLDSKSEAAQEAIDSFITDEQAARNGDFEPMRKRRLEEGDLKSRPNNELNEETNSGATASISAQAFPAPDEIEDAVAEQRKTDMMNAARDIIGRQLDQTRTDDKEGSVDIGSLYLELAKDYPDVIDQFKFRNLDEVKKALTDASIDKNAKPEKTGGAIKPKKKEAAPVIKKEVSQEENDRLVALMNSLEANKNQPKAYTPSRDKGDMDVYSSRGALNETDVALNEVHNIKNRYHQEYLEGMANHEANPSVFEAAGDTYLRAGNENIRVGETHSLGDLLTKGFRYGSTNPRLTEFVTSLIRKYASNVPVHVISREELNLLNPGADAYYHPAGYIVLPWELTQQDNEIYNRVVIHEGVHAALANRLNENPTAVAQLHALAKLLREESGISRQDYMWTNAHEFLSEVLSRADIQEALKNTPLTPELAKMLGVKQWRQTSLWKALIERIADWLGYRGPMNALEGALAVVDRLERNDLTVNEETADDRFSFRANRRMWPHPQELMASRGALSLPTKEEVTSAVIDTVSDQSNAYFNKIKRFGIKAATLDQLRQSTAGLFVDKNGKDVMEKLVSAVQRMAPYAQSLRDQSDKLSQRFLDLKRLDPDMADRFADLAIEATTTNVRLGPGADNKHLGKGGRNAQGKGRLNELQREFNNLSQEAQKLYSDMAAYYRNMQNEHAREIVENRLQQYGVNPPDRQGFIDRVINGNTTEADKNLFKDKGNAFERIKEVSDLRVIQGDYFNLMRYGKFIVNTRNNINDLMGGTEIEPGKVEFRAKTVKAARALAEAFAANVDLHQTNFQQSPTSQANDFGFIVSVQRDGAHYFESEAEAIKWRRDNADKFDQISQVSPVRETGKDSSDLTTGQLNSLMATINNSNYSDEEKEIARDMVRQGSAVLMSGNRIQKRGIARRKVKGASTDFGRNVLQYGEAASSRMAQLKFRPQIDEALNEMREINKKLMDKEAPKRTAVLNEVSARIDEGVTNVKEPGKFIKDLMTLTFLGKLASPMYSVVNAMQPWMVTLPVLSGRFGAIRAAAVLQQAYSSLGFSENVMAGITNTYRAGKNFNATAFDTTDTVASIKRNLAKDKDGAELNKLIDELLERGAMSSGGFELAQSISQGRGVWGTKLAQVDRIARQLPQSIEDINRAATAVAAYRLARSNMTEEKARAFAFDTVMNTQGDYSGVNAPRAFNNPYLRPALQFKKYAQMMGYLLADMSHRAFAGADVETRREARKQLTAIMGVQIAMAGALSLPGIEIAKVGFMVAGALGIGGGWDDEEEKLRKLADDTFGKTWGELLTRGVISRELNIDLSQRLSLADMATFGEPGDYERDGVDAYLWRMFAGAPYSTMNDLRLGIQDAVNGDFGKAAERVIPVKVIADTFKAANKFSEGKIYPSEMAMNVFGVKSGRQAEENRKTGNSIRNNEAIAAKHKELTNKYLAAKTAGERIKIRAQIVEFNKTAPLRQKVFPNALEKVRHRQEMERVS